MVTTTVVASLQQDLSRTQLPQIYMKLHSTIPLKIRKYNRSKGKQLTLAHESFERLP